MLGTWINVGGIVAGGIIGLTVGRSIPASVQEKIKAVLAILVIWVGLSTTWKAVNGTFGQVMGQLGIVLLSLSLGNFTGTVLRLQKGVNWLGRRAKSSFEDAAVQGQNPSEGFITCTLLFCVGPMAVLGALQDGLSGEFRTLAVKGIMDGLATMVFVNTFGWLVILSAIPVLVYQGTITLMAKSLEPYLTNQALLDSVNATGGLVIFCISLVILEIRRVEVANYLPSLIFAPLLTYWWR